MADQFQTIITHFNGLTDSHIFTSVDMKNALAGVVNPSAITSFLNLAFKMDVVDKDKIQKPAKGGPRLNFMKLRSLNQTEIKGLTIYPDCIDFKKALEADYKKRMGVVTPIELPVKDKPRPITVRSYKRKKPMKKVIGHSDHIVTVSDHKDRLVVTIYK